jgi:adenylate cyclase
MAEEGFKRKLTAILSADVVGYSRLMEDNEQATIQTLNTYRNSMSTLIQQHRGRVVDTTGDNLLAEFSSVVDAVKCAVETQKELSERNADLPENRRMLFRIGVNLGDIVEEDDRIYGDGVNIAARLEGLAEAGGICISRTAYDHVKKKLELGYEYLGEPSVKNISEPVHVYRVLMEPEAAGKVIGEKRFLGRISRKTAMAAIIVLVIVAGGLIGWNIYLHQSKKIDPASLDKMAYPLPDKPSIAVLPFDNLSGDPEQEFFSDGLSEELITALSKVPKLFVIARNSTFTYKGKPVKVQQVSEELGVRYVLEGSVRMVENSVRITAQLIDAISGRHLWAERYDRDLNDIFALQDEITMKIVTALRVQLTDGEFARLIERHTNNLQAYLKILEGTGYWHVSKYSEAMKYFEEAVSLDPQYVSAYAWLSWTHLMNVWFGPSSTRKQSLKKAFEFAEKCRALDDTHGGCHGALSHAYLMKRDYDRAISEGKQAVELDPNMAMWAIHYGWALRSVGRYEDALREYERAYRLNPLDTRYALGHICTTYNVMRRHEEAIETCKKAIELTPRNLPSFINLAVAYSELDKMDEAREAANKVLKMYPNFSVESFGKTLPYKNKADRDLFVRGLLKARLK